MRPCLPILAAIALATGRLPGQAAFDGHSEPIDGRIQERIVGSSWHRGCPVAPRKLRLLELESLGLRR